MNQQGKGRKSKDPHSINKGNAHRPVTLFRRKLQKPDGAQKEPSATRPLERAFRNLGRALCLPRINLAAVQCQKKSIKTALQGRKDLVP